MVLSVPEKVGASDSIGSPTSRKALNASDSACPEPLEMTRFSGVISRRSKRAMGVVAMHGRILGGVGAVNPMLEPAARGGRREAGPDAVTEQAPLRQQVGHADAGARRGERTHDVSRPE